LEQAAVQFRSRVQNKNNMKDFYSSSDLQSKLSISRPRLYQLKESCLIAGEDYITVGPLQIFYKPSAIEKLRARQKQNKKFRNKVPH